MTLAPYRTRGSRTRNRRPGRPGVRMGNRDGHGAPLLFKRETGNAVVGLDTTLRIMVEPQEEGQPIVVSDPDALLGAVSACEEERERVLAETADNVIRHPMFASLHENRAT